jgi:phospholipase/carboxylesterase
MFTSLALHGSNQREDWLRDYVGEIAPDLRHFLPRGTLVDGESFIFFRRRLDRSIDQAEILAQASRSLEPGGCIRPPDNRRFLAVGFSSGAIFATAPLSLVPDLFVGCHSPCAGVRIRASAMRRRRRR